MTRAWDYKTWRDNEWVNVRNRFIATLMKMEVAKPIRFSLGNH